MRNELKTYCDYFLVVHLTPRSLESLNYFNYYGVDLEIIIPMFIERFMQSHFCYNKP